MKDKKGQAASQLEPWAIGIAALVVLGLVAAKYFPKIIDWITRTKSTGLV